MNIKVIYSLGGAVEKGSEQKVADRETVKTAKKIAQALKSSGNSVKLVKVTPSDIPSVGKLKADVIFNLCEWSGRDSQLGVEVLKNLEKAKVNYTGADSKSYFWDCDKSLMKKMFDKKGILTPKWITVLPDEAKFEILKKIKKLKFPLFAKPAYEHCAIGIDRKSVLKNEKDAITRINLIIKKYKQPAIVEEYIDGREFTLTVVKTEKVNVFPAAEEIFISENGGERYMSFNAKWSLGETFSSVILKDEKLTKKLQDVASNVFLKMGCRGYVRIDTRLRGDKIYVLEVNVNPSLLPEDNYGLTVATEYAGWDFKKLVSEIAHSAL